MEQIGCHVLDERGNLIAIERASSEYTIRINIDVDSEDFGSHTTNKFVLLKSSAKHLIDSVRKIPKLCNQHMQMQ